MSNLLLKEIKAKMDEFFSKASDVDIKKALKGANYEAYTGVDPDKLSLHEPVSTYSLPARYVFTYSMDVPFEGQAIYELCLSCSVAEADNYPRRFKIAA